MLLVSRAPLLARVAPAAAAAAAPRLRASLPPAARKHPRMSQPYGAHVVAAATGARTPADDAVAAALDRAGLHVVLGSKSSTRRAILTEMGVSHEIVTADIDEKAIRRDDPKELVLALADAKADAIVARLRTDSSTIKSPIDDALLITADQVVVYDGVIREKPESEAEARAFIAGYGVAPAVTVGAIAVTDLRTGRRVVRADSSSIAFDPVPEEVIDFLVEEGECAFCAGGLMVEHPKMAPLTREIKGSMDSLMGLSKTVVGGLLMDAIAEREKAGGE